MTYFRRRTSSKNQYAIRGLPNTVSRTRRYVRIVIRGVSQTYVYSSHTWPPKHDVVSQDVVRMHLVRTCRYVVHTVVVEKSKNESLLNTQHMWTPLLPVITHRPTHRPRRLGQAVPPMFFIMCSGTSRGSSCSPPSPYSSIRCGRKTSRVSCPRS